MRSALNKCEHLTDPISMNQASVAAKKKLSQRVSHYEGYDRFDCLNGQHPFQQAVPEGVICYPVRELKTGKISYFNFELAKTMGLIDENHSSHLNHELEKKLLQTFCIRIINEYDQHHQIKYPIETIKQKKYMATRYLQLQHKSKTGKTSGDGRCIWNGVVHHKGQIWDVSSRGTGVTCLAPGAVQAERPLRSGNTRYGYGCGLAEIDELYGAAIMAEIFHNNGLVTERMLCIVDLGRGMGIGVRAGKNLMRPAHLFIYLKQNQHNGLQRAVDYFIDRQERNKSWRRAANLSKKYDYFLEQICEIFARFAAVLDREYIFAWLDWDGDNVLADAGIIDYGSVRQFGLRHDQYRYDDIERFSTNLSEQRRKIRTIVQVFAQMTDFLKTRNRKPIKHFQNHAILKKFDVLFERSLRDRFLYQLGFNEMDRDILLFRYRKTVDNLFATYTDLEKMKTHRRLRKVADGINRPAIINMRALNRQLPHLVLISADQFSTRTMICSLLAETATQKDRKNISQRKIQLRLKRLIHQFRHLTAKLVTTKRPLSDIAIELENRSHKINREERMTGNGLINVVHEILVHRKKGLSDSEIQIVMESLIHDQQLDPDAQQKQDTAMATWTDRSQRLMRTLLTVVDGYKEDI